MKTKEKTEDGYEKTETNISEYMEAKHDEAQVDQKNKEKEAEVKDENKEKENEVGCEVVPVVPQDVGGQKRDPEAAIEEAGSKRQKTRNNDMSRSVSLVMFSRLLLVKRARSFCGRGHHAPTTM